jgi:hypothetical protein
MIDRSPFRNKASWKVYNQLFWNSSFAPELENAAEKIVNKLSNRTNSISTSPIQVLILGIGTGTIEFPLLASIERKAGRKVIITGIDLNREPLLFTKYLLERGLQNLPISTEHFIEQLNNFDWEHTSNSEFTYEKWGTGDGHLLVRDNLDYEMVDYQEGKDIITTHRPSKWTDRLRKSNKRFDIVFSSFFLTHIDWWRTTLANALNFVGKDSLFMYSSGQGDTRLLEGQLNLRNENNKTFTEILLNEDRGYFTREGIRDYKNLPKPINAVRSFALENLLKHWEHDGLISCKNDDGTSLLKYKIKNIVSGKTCIEMLEQRTFSALRTIDSLIGVKENNSAIREVKSIFNNNIKDEDTLEFDMELHLYIRKDDPKIGKEDPNDDPTNPTSDFYFGNRLTGNLDKNRSPELDGIKLFREYEYFTAWNEPISDKENLGTLNSTLPGKIARYLNLKGVLDPSCVGGVIRDIDGKGNTEFKYFLNYSYQDIAIQELYLKSLYFYLNSRKSEHSNTSILLTSIIPIVIKPCVFSYKLSDILASDLGVKFIEHSSFDEIQFSCSNKIFNSLSSLQNKCNLELREIIDNTSDKVAFSIRIEKESIVEGNIEAIRQTLELAELSSELGVNLAEFDCGHKSLIDKLKNALTKEVVFAIWSTFVIREAKTTVIYPFTYHVDNKPQADRAILLFYDSDIDSKIIDHEYIKINLMYKILKGSEDSQKGGNIIGKLATQEEFGHEIRSINIFCKRLFSFLIEKQNIDIDPEDSDYLYKIGLAAHDYIDLWAAVSNETISGNIVLNKGSFNEIFWKKAKYMAFVKIFPKIEISTIIRYKTHIKNILDNSLNIDVIFEEKTSLNPSFNKPLMAILVNSIYHCIEFHRNNISKSNSSLEDEIAGLSQAQMYLCVFICGNPKTSKLSKIYVLNECDNSKFAYNRGKDFDIGTKAVVRSVLKNQSDIRGIDIDMDYVEDNGQNQDSQLGKILEFTNAINRISAKASLFYTYLKINYANI